MDLFNNITDYLESITPPRIMKWINIDKPLIKSEIEIDLIECSECNQEIDYSEINKMDCMQVGGHTKSINELNIIHYVG